MEKTIFKVGDEVYYYDLEKGCLKGEIIKILNDSDFPIEVKFKYYTITFDFKGVYVSGEIPTLSFAPYDFINGGFTQERPLPEIEVDTLVYVKLFFSDSWSMRYFSHFKNRKMYVFHRQLKSTKTKEAIEVSEWSLINPLEK